MYVHYSLFPSAQFKFVKQIISSVMIMIFSAFVVLYPHTTYAQGIPATSLTQLNLPVPGAMVPPSESFNPYMLKGLTIYPENPLKFDFIIDPGDNHSHQPAIEEEPTKLIKYFMAALTIPENEIWVNLSPYEKDRIMPDNFSRTLMGKDLLTQDYLLKQLTASLIRPDNNLGREFWDKVYKQLHDKLGAADIPIDTFNKVWIVPESALIYEHEKGALIVDSYLKVMHEEDYLALDNRSNNELPRAESFGVNNVEYMRKISNEVFREVLIPEIEREINEGKTFANLRQIYNSVILAMWYKQTFKNSILGQVYIDKNMTSGIDIKDAAIKFKIYDQYLEALQKGVYNAVEEVYDPRTRKFIPRKYFSGGAKIQGVGRLVERRIGRRIFDGGNLNLQERVFDAAAGPKLTVTAKMEGTGSSPIESVISENFSFYYKQFDSLSAKTQKNFEERKWQEINESSKQRVQLYDLLVARSALRLKNLIQGALFNQGHIDSIQERFLSKIHGAHRRNLAEIFLNDVIKSLDMEDDIVIEPPTIRVDDLSKGDLGLTRRYARGDYSTTAKLIERLIKDTKFNVSFNNLDEDAHVSADLIEEQLRDLRISDEAYSLEVLTPLFFRNTAAYIIGRVMVNQKSVPIIFSIRNPDRGLTIDAVLVGRDITRNVAVSSTRSSFHVSASEYQNVVRFISVLFPETNIAYIYESFGFDQISRTIHDNNLRESIEGTEGSFQFLAMSPESLVFQVSHFPLVFKIILGSESDLESIIHDYEKVNVVDRFGQLLNSLLYRNFVIDRRHISQELLHRLTHAESPDVEVTDSHVIFRRVYAQRKVTSVPNYIASVSSEKARDIILSIGWNIKHLAEMGLVPTSLTLSDFGVTTWGRVVYLNSAATKEIESIQFEGSSQPGERQRRDGECCEVHLSSLFPSEFETQLAIPGEHRESFNEIHGDLFSADFWEFMKWQQSHSQQSDIFPYPMQYRLEIRRQQDELTRSLARLGISYDTGNIRRVIIKAHVQASQVQLSGLDFLRLEVPNPRARVLVVEPISSNVIGILHERLGNVNFDVILPQSEVVEDAAYWVPGIRGRLNELVQSQRYDYVLGYINETFDSDFFEVANIKGLLLFSTGIHNIDIEAATAHHTIVTNAPGATTAALAEHNIGLVLDALYSSKLREEGSPGSQRLTDMVKQHSYDPVAVSQIMWYDLLRRILRLDEMFKFGISGKYTRTGIGEKSTIYHDQIGQNQEAGIMRGVGVIGLDEIGINLLELAIAHEAASIYILEDEYGKLSPQQVNRLTSMIEIVESFSKNEDVRVKIVPTDLQSLLKNSHYILRTPRIGPEVLLAESESEYPLVVDPNNIFLDDPSVLDLSLVGYNNGIQGFGRIGEAVAQRSVVLGLNLFVNQRGNHRREYQRKKLKIDQLAENRNQAHDDRTEPLAYVEIDPLFQKSNVLSILTPLTDETRRSVDGVRLNQLGTKAPGGFRVLISQVKDVVDERALELYLQSNPDSQARLDIVTDEERGDAHQRFIGSDGEALSNVKISGHSAAAVREVRDMKIKKALQNLRDLLNGKMPDNILNNLAMMGREEIEISGLKFVRLNARRPQARVLVVEPVGDEIITELGHRFPDTDFDILLPESELEYHDGRWVPSINPKLGGLIESGQYDYCLGYCNAQFDSQFFEGSSLKGLILFASATHHIDVEAATNNNVLVTMAAGPTTVAVSEQNIGLVLDGLYSGQVHKDMVPGTQPLTRLMDDHPYDTFAVSQILWFSLLRKALRLDDMFEFGMSGRYTRTGVTDSTTIYHDQIGQDREIGVDTSLGIIGLDEIGLNLIEYAIAHEVSTIYVLRAEYEKLDDRQKRRLDDMIAVIEKVSPTKGINIEIKRVDNGTLMEKSTYTIRTPRASDDILESESSGEKNLISVDAQKVYVSDAGILLQSLNNLNFGIFGLSRIGPAVVQRALGFGANMLIHYRTSDPQRGRKRIERINQLAKERMSVFGSGMKMPRLISKEELFAQSNILTTLAPSSIAENTGWVDGASLELFGTHVINGPQVFVNVVKGQVNEPELIVYLSNHPEVQARLDVVSHEDRGDAHTRFVDDSGELLPNVKISGHTAAAVSQVRLFKIRKALENLRKILDGRVPDQILNDISQMQRPDLQKGGSDGTSSASSPVGGIDLTSGLIKLQIERNEHGLLLPIDEQPVIHLRINRLEPVIINVAPLHNLFLQLGLSEESAPKPHRSSDHSDISFYRNEDYDRKKFHPLSCLL